MGTQPISLQFQEMGNPTDIASVSEIRNRTDIASVSEMGHRTDIASVSETGNIIFLFTLDPERRARKGSKRYM
jgi:hypothetical protein